MREFRNLSAFDFDMRGIRGSLAAVALIVATATLVSVLAASAAQAADPSQFGVKSFEASVGEPQAAAHADVTTDVIFDSHDAPHFGLPAPYPNGGGARDISVALPKGLVGNPQAAPMCDAAALNTLDCPVAAQVGVASLVLASYPAVFFPPDGVIENVPIYNMKPSRGQTAAFGFNAVIRVYIAAHVRSDGDYGITATSSSITNSLPPVRVRVTLWGVPFAAAHDAQRSCDGDNQNLGCSSGLPPVPFMTNPSACGTPNQATLVTRSWAQPASWLGPIAAPMATMTGCEKLTFQPSLTAASDTTAPNSSMGLSMDLEVPQAETPNATGTPPLKRAVVRLPQGISLNPDAADGLQACTDAQVGLHQLGPATCPLASKIGEATLVTPVLADPVQGALYLGSQESDDPTSGKMFRIFLVLDSPERGLTVKLEGAVVPDPTTGQVTATFDQNPQLPFSSLHLRFKGGARAPLATPGSCGTKTVDSELSSWGGQDVDSRSNLTFDCASGLGSFSPSFEAGTVGPVAGASSPFTLQIHKPDVQSELNKISMTLPAGLLATLKGNVGTRVGTARVASGPGSNPFWLSGPVVLEGPYGDAPFSLRVTVPVVAGPFNLGDVVVRQKIYVDPVTAQVRVVSDPLPTIVKGVPVRLQDLSVSIDKPGFMLNPTSCEPKSIDGTLGAITGQTATVSNRFQVGDCGSLPFHPKLALRVFGKTNRNAKPRLRAVVTARPGDANIARAQVNLPHSEFIEQNHIKTVCTRVQWSAGAGHGSQCPAGSIYGYAKAWTPLLDRPLQGPVYLRSSSHKLPDLVAALNGQVDIELAGKIDSGPNRGIRNTFEVVPDAPVSRFVLTMKGGRKGLLVNSENLCRKGAKTRAIVRFTGQNGRVEHFKPKVRNGCRAHASGGVHRKKGSHSHASPRRGGRGGR